MARNSENKRKKDISWQSTVWQKWMLPQNPNGRPSLSDPSRRASMDAVLPTHLSCLIKAAGKYVKASSRDWKSELYGTYSYKVTMSYSYKSTMDYAYKGTMSDYYQSTLCD